MRRVAASQIKNEVFGNLVPHVGTAASSSGYIVAFVLREPIWPRNAVLDGRFYTAEPFALLPFEHLSKSSRRLAAVPWVYKFLP
jgi:hypothetical protein